MAEIVLPCGMNRKIMADLVGSAILFFNRQGKRECTALPFASRLGPNMAAVRLHEGAGDRQADATSSPRTKQQLSHVKFW